MTSTELQIKNIVYEEFSKLISNIEGDFKTNFVKKRYNFLLSQLDETITANMVFVSSFESKSGFAIETCAKRIARLKFGDENVPAIVNPRNVNLIVLYNVGASIKVSTISYPLRNGMSQKVYWTNKPVEDFLNKKLRKLFDNKSEKICIKTFKVECESQVIEKIKKEFDKRDAKGNGIPIDLFVLNQVDDRRIAYSYELKAGGNLDTKNAPSNAAEVTSLETIFSFCDKSISRFATCYDGKGDGTPDGAIGKHLDRNQILIGKEFWEEILEDGVSYNDFILAYQEAYKKAKVEETVIG